MIKIFTLLILTCFRANTSPLRRSQDYDDGLAKSALEMQSLLDDNFQDWGNKKREMGNKIGSISFVEGLKISGNKEKRSEVRKEEDLAYGSGDRFNNFETKHKRQNNIMNGYSKRGKNLTTSLEMFYPIK
eukprot:TCONS_00048715-protein